MYSRLCSWKVILCFTLVYFIYEFSYVFHKDEITNIKFGYSTPVNLERHIPPKKVKTDAVILLTQMRSGSSFVGEIFNRNPGISYFYEPLYPYGVCNRKHKTDVADYFKAIFKYDFEKVKELYRNAIAYSGVLRKTCLTQAMCFIGMEKCGKFLSRDLKMCVISNGLQKCPNKLNLTKLSERMKTQDLFVFKVIRLCDIKDIEPILTDPNFNVKIVHLVRDPRAILNSRNLSADTAKNISDMSSSLCSQLESLVSYNNPSILNSSNYFLVRHEDISLHPVQWAERIYDFIGFSLDYKVKKWLEHATSANNSNLLAQKLKYGTTRNSSDVISHWRNELEYTGIEYVQNLCKISMKKLGYFSFNNYNDVKNLTNPSFGT